MVAIVAHRFRLDRSRGKCINVMHMLNIQLVSYKMSDVETFVKRVRLVLCSLDEKDIQDKQLLYQWLWEKFENYSPISNKC